MLSHVGCVVMSLRHASQQCFLGLYAIFSENTRCIRSHEKRTYKLRENIKY